MSRLNWKYNRDELAPAAFWVFLYSTVLIMLIGPASTTLSSAQAAEWLYVAAFVLISWAGSGVTLVVCVLTGDRSKSERSPAAHD